MRVIEVLLAATPSPTPTFDPVDVTPGPAGFFATIGLMLAVGLIAMAFMRQATRASAKYDLREAREREQAAREVKDSANNRDSDSH